jgi:hypothetical protein
MSQAPNSLVELKSSRKLAAWAIRTVIDVALALHLVGAATYWWRSPHGFPISSSRFWLNSVVPIVWSVVALIGLIGVHRRCWSIAAIAVLCFASVWCAGAIASHILFPSSLRGVWVLGVVAAASAFACFVWLIIRQPRRYASWTLCSVLSACVGVFMVSALKAPTASTQPLNAPLPEVVKFQTPSPAEPNIRLGDGYKFSTSAARLLMSVDTVQIQCSPILEFDRISSDGFWSLFAPNNSSDRLPISQFPDAGVRAIRYSDGSIVVIAPTATDDALQVIAYSTIERDTYSHLNTFCYLEISGHRRLSLSFSPCANQQIEVLPSDYPAGRPERLAYLDDVNTFHVVEATSGEKGPFHPLATGRLRRGDPLTIIIQDEGRPIAEIALGDWSQQVSTELSPTGGWRLPMNAIEFNRFYDPPDSTVGIWMSLAATSVGRGWDTVGHRAGTYRNSMVFRRIPIEAGSN